MTSKVSGEVDSTRGKTKALNRDDKDRNICIISNSWRYCDQCAHSCLAGTMPEDLDRQAVGRIVSRGCHQRADDPRSHHLVVSADSVV